MRVIEKLNHIIDNTWHIQNGPETSLYDSWLGYHPPNYFTNQESYNNLYTPRNDNFAGFSGHPSLLERVWEHRNRGWVGFREGLGLVII